MWNHSLVQRDPSLPCGACLPAKANEGTTFCSNSSRQCPQATQATAFRSFETFQACRPALKTLHTFPQASTAFLIKTLPGSVHKLLKPQHSTFRAFKCAVCQAPKLLKPFTAVSTSYSSHSILLCKIFKGAVCQAPKTPQTLPGSIHKLLKP